MHEKLQNLRLLDGRQILAIAAIGLFLCTLLAGMLGGIQVQAATSSTLNFQARLMNGDGSIAPDGNYNIEFKLYNTPDTGATAQGICTGSCVWVETRTGVNAVTVANGYVTVNLGSVNPFNNNINWDQELWLTMNVGGTAGARWDGEMSPRLKLTAVPYAFQAGGLTQQNGTTRSTLGFGTQTGSNNILLPDESGILCIQGSDDCGFMKGGLQGVYDSSFSPQIVINESNGAVIIRSDTGGLVDELLKIQSNDGSKTYLSVNRSGVSIDGTLGVSTLGAADTANFLCYNSAGQIAACDITDSMQTIMGVLDATNLVFSGETQQFGADGAVTNVDAYSTIAINAAADDLRINIPAPSAARQKVGRVLYITAVSDSKEFTIVLDGTAIEVPMKANSTATLVWNGTGWTVSGGMGSEAPDETSADNSESYLGSMYYDATTGNIACYEAEGWGQCAAAPDNIVSLTPEYAGGVIGSEGTGVMSADFCSNDDDLMVNDQLCASGQARNFYRWTSSETSQQTRSIYVTYRLSANFKGFVSDDTVQLTARVDDTANASVTYEMFRDTGSDIVQCFTESRVTDVIAGGGGGAGVWQTYGINGNEATDCGFDETAAGGTIIFKINLSASNGANAYVSALNFVTRTH